MGPVDRVTESAGAVEFVPIVEDRAREAVAPKPENKSEVPPSSSPAVQLDEIAKAEEEKRLQDTGAWIGIGIFFSLFAGMLLFVLFGPKGSSENFGGYTVVRFDPYSDPPTTYVSLQSRVSKRDFQWMMSEIKSTDRSEKPLYVRFYDRPQLGDDHLVATYSEGQASPVIYKPELME